MDNIYFLPVMLQVLGTVVVFIEVIIPSGGILGLISFSLFGYSLYYVFSSISTPAGMGFVVADLIIVPVVVVFAFKYLARSPATLSRELSSKDGVSSQSKELEAFAGKEGVALSDLRPSGTAMIEDRKVDVVTKGDYIPAETKVVVLKVTGNQIIVKKI